MSRTPRFERLEPIGTGATSRVDLARLTARLGDVPAGRLVAVKTLNEGVALDDEARTAFRAEAEAGAAAQDPSLVRVLHLGEEEGRPFLLLQYVPGRSLREILEREGPLPEPLLRRVGAQLAGALAALHAAGLVHGDVKPENVRLDDEGRAVLVDLGFARRFQEAGEPGRRAAGSLAYLSPERARGGPPSRQADVFALGVVLYELATGVHPFGYRLEGGSGRSHELGHGSTSIMLLRRSIEVPGADALLAAIATARFVRPSHLNPRLSPFLDALLEETLARSQRGRPSAGELRERLAAGEAGEWWRRRLDQGPQESPAQRSGLHLLPLVGRERELAELSAELERVRARQRVGVVWLTSAEGGGKWRLISEFAARARATDDPPTYLYARWTEVSESRSAGLLALLLYRWLRLPLDAEPGQRERALLEELVSPASARTLVAALAPAPRRFDQSVSIALAEWLTALGRRGSVILFLDDLQNAGEVTIEALSAFLDAVGESRILLVLGVRDDGGQEPPHLQRFHERLLHGHEGSPAAVTLRLEPLGEEDVAKLVTELFDRKTPRVRLSEALWKRSQGNPGLLTEILYDVIEKGHAVMAESADGKTRKLHLVVSPEELPRPRSVERIIAERLRGMEPGDRRWLERLAVIGARIRPDFLVAAFPPTDRREADAVLARLTRLGWIVGAGDRYRFARPALREAVYRALSPARRRRMHLAAAHGLAGEGDPSAEKGFQRAFHLRAAGEREELVELVIRLGRSERRRASARRLFTLAEWGLSALEGTPASPERERQRLELLETAADAADRLGFRDEQRVLLDSMIDVDLDLDVHPSEGARLYLLHARFASGTGQFGLARGMLRNAVQLADAADDPALASEARRRMAQVQAQIGEFEEARRHAEQALELAQGANQVALAHLSLAHLDVLVDRPEEGLRRVASALEALRAADEVRLGVVAYANILRARILRSAGQARRALGSIRRAIRLARRAGERRLEAEARARYGGLLLDLDRADDGETQLRDALLLADEIEDRRGQVLARLWLGLLLWEEDDREAEAMIERGIDVADDIGFHRAESFGLAILARVRRAAGDLREAEAASERAVTLQERHGAELPDRIAVSGTRALVLRSLGREREARAVLRELEQRITRGLKRIEDPRLARDQRAYTERLREAVLSPEGPVYPRTGP